MGQFDFLLGARPVHTPDPMELATKTIALSQLMDQATLRKFAMQQMLEQRAANEALSRALPNAISGLPPEVQDAMRSNPQAAAKILEVFDARRKSEGDYANTQAQAQERLANAQKTRMVPVSNQLYFLSNKKDLTPDDVALGQKLIADNGLEKVLPAVPFQQWGNTDIARNIMGIAGRAAFEAEKQASQAETEIKNRDDSKRQWANTESEMARRTAQTAQDWARIGIEREKMGKPEFKEGQWVYPPTSGQPGRAVPVQGYTKPKDEAAVKQDRYRMDMATRAMEIIDEALPKVSGQTTGVAGAVLGNVPGTRAYNFRESIEPLKSMLTIDTLQAMRQMSPTGGALGNVSDYENRMLAAAVSSLNTAQDPAQYRQALTKVKTHLGNVIRLINGGAAGPQLPPGLKSITPVGGGG